MPPRDDGAGTGQAADDPHAARRRWMGILAKAQPAEIEAAWAALAPAPGYAVLRAPETGLVMVRGRIGGTGDPFSFGEMTMTRCVVRLAAEPGVTGFSFVAGRDRRHAELAAVLDALAQSPGEGPRVRAQVIEPLAQRQAARRLAAARHVAPTRVEFFTMVRE